mgnify:CR=1 FL=1
MSGVDNKRILSGTMKENSEFVSTEEYFGNALKNVENIESIDMHFTVVQSGLQVLKKLICFMIWLKLEYEKDITKSPQCI